MSQIAIKGATTGTGVFTLESPATNTDRTLVLPDEAGTVLTSGTPTVFPKGVPAFSAYLLSSQTVSSATWTKIAFNGESWDTNNNYDKDTNYRFTPTVAGYYQVNVCVGPYGSGEPSRAQVGLYKNGSIYLRLWDVQIAASGSWANGTSGSGLVYLNGSTDYIEVYIYLTVKSGTPTIESTVSATSFSGVLVRAD